MRNLSGHRLLHTSAKAVVTSDYLCPILYSTSLPGKDLTDCLYVDCGRTLFFFFGDFLANSNSTK